VTTDKLIRAAGVGIVVGSVLFGLFPLLHPDHVAANFLNTPLWVAIHLLPHIGAILFLFGLPAIFVRQREQAGWLGLAAYILPTIALAQLLMVAWLELFILPWIGLQNPDLENGPGPTGTAAASMLMNYSLGIGFGVLGLSIVRAGVLPRGAGILMLGGALFYGFADMLLHVVVPDSTLDLFLPGFVLFAVGMAAVGLALLRGAKEQVALPATALRRLAASVEA